MSANTEQSLKLAFTVAKEKALTVLGDSHTGADAKTSIKTLIQIVEAYRDLMVASTGVTADARVMKKRFEQSRSENNQLEEQLAAMKKQILALATEVEMLGVEAGQIMKRNADNASSPDHKAAERIMSSALRVVDVVMGILRPPKAG
jgi:hypothetical protein